MKSEPAAPDHRATAFGLTWRSDTALTSFAPRPPSVGPADIIVRRVFSLADRQPLSHINRGFVCEDGVRFAWEREAVFDLFDGRRIDYLVGDGWRGAFPASFYSTMAALTLAWRGAVPLHACAVEVDGRAVLIGGPPGVGKSTLAAALLAEGARFIADDLSVVEPEPTRARSVVHPGRPSMRLYPNVADWLGCAALEQDYVDPRGKILIRPSGLYPSVAVPLAGFLILGGGSGPIPREFSHALLSKQLFRPRWLAALPNAAARISALFAIAKDMGFIQLELEEVRDEVVFRRQAKSALALIRSSMLG